MVRNFFVALAASGNKQAYEYVSGNLGQSMTHRHAQRIIASRHTVTSFINATDNEIKLTIQKFISVIHENFGEINPQVVFSLGIDTTVLVKSFQFSLNLGATAGGVHQNHCIDDRGKTANEIHSVLKVCIN